jgi:C-terminal processing protease CtpA/Prc
LINKPVPELKLKTRVYKSYYAKEDWPYYDNQMEFYETKSDTVLPHDKINITVPIVVLVGHGTACAAEEFIIYLDFIKRATLVGQVTFGSAAQPLFFDLPRGIRLKIATGV